MSAGSEQLLCAESRFNKLSDLDPSGSVAYALLLQVNLKQPIKSGMFCHV